MKEYEITGCHYYLTNFNFTVMANNQKEAKEKAEEIAKEHEDPAMAEMVECIIDTPTPITNEDNKNI